MLSSLAVFVLDKTDIYIAAGVAVLTALIMTTIYVVRHGILPSMNTLSDLCTMVNTKGGIIVLLTGMWLLTLGGTTAICLWAIIHGVDPQNGILVVLLSVLTSGAWGNVNGALFKTMTGDEPTPPVPPTQ